MLPRKLMVKLLLETQQLLQKFLVNLRAEMKRSRRNQQQALPVQQMDMQVPLNQIKRRPRKALLMAKTSGARMVWEIQINMSKV